jgi:hypothetical protein
MRRRAGTSRTVSKDPLDIGLEQGAGRPPGTQGRVPRPTLPKDRKRQCAAKRDDGTDSGDDMAARLQSGARREHSAHHD